MVLLLIAVGCGSNEDTVNEEVMEIIEANSFNIEDGDNYLSVDDAIEIVNDIYAGIEGLNTNNSKNKNEEI